MNTIINLYSMQKNEILRFLNAFYDNHIDDIQDNLKWEQKYTNPIEMVDIIGAFIDNNDKYNINMWVSLDDGFFINVNNNNANQIIKYLYERYPY